MLTRCIGWRIRTINSHFRSRSLMSRGRPAVYQSIAEFPTQSLIAYIHVIPSTCARFTYTLQRTTLCGFVSAENSFCAEQKTCEPSWLFSRTALSRERETREELNRERERNVSRWEAGARLLWMHAADSTCSGIPAHHCRFEFSTRSYLVSVDWFGDAPVGIRRFLI